MTEVESLTVSATVSSLVLTLRHPFRVWQLTHFHRLQLHPSSVTHYLSDDQQRVTTGSAVLEAGTTT